MLKRLWGGFLLPLLLLVANLLAAYVISTADVDPVFRGILLSLLFLFAAVTGLWLLSRWFDWLSGVRFKHHVAPVILQDARAAAHYYGLRLLALAILVGWVLSSVRF